MIKRCLLYVLSFALCVTGLSTGYSDNAGAWSTNPLPLCVFNPGVIDSNWQQDIHDDHPEFSLSEGSYIIGRTVGDTDQNHATVWWQDNDNPIYMMRQWYNAQDSFGFALREQVNNALVQLNEAGIQSASWNSSSGGALSINDLSCMGYANGLHYVEAADLTGGGQLAWAGWPTTASWAATIPEVPPVGGGGSEPACAAWDFGCYIGRVIENVGDFFEDIGNSLTDLANALIGGIAALFIPDPVVMQTAWQNLVDSFTAQLGFLLAPFEFIASVIDHIVDDPVSDCVVFGGATPFLGSSATMDFCKLDEQLPIVFNFIRIVAQAGVLLWLLSAFSHKYYEVVKA